MGYIRWLGTSQGIKGTGKEKDYESEMVTELPPLGAVLYVKTSVPHTLMCGETIARKLSSERQTLKTSAFLEGYSRTTS